MGATPNAPATPFRRVEPLRPDRVRRSVAADRVAVEKVPAGEPGHGMARSPIARLASQRGATDRE